MAKKQTHSLLQYAEKLSRQLRENEQRRTADAYLSAVRSIQRFELQKDLELEDLTGGFLKRYENHLKEEGREMNTISFYMRNLRAIYNRAVREELLPHPLKNPFADVYTGVATTRKRALTKEEMTKLSDFEVKLSQLLQKETEEECPENPIPFHCEEDKPQPSVKTDVPKNIIALYESLLLFLFCFHGRGISFIDLCLLRNAHVHGNEIRYCRKKTGKELTVKITPPMQKILDYFRNRVKDSPFLFPLLSENGKQDIRTQYGSALRKQNQLLKDVARQAGIRQELTTHVARHSWATIAHHKQVSLSVISQALGHRDEKTTSIYLDSFRPSVINRVSEEISRLFGQEKYKRQETRNNNRSYV